MEPDNEQLSIARQCELLGKSRSWYYYRPYTRQDRLETDNADKELIEEISEEIPFYGYRKIALEAGSRSRPLSFKRAYRLCRELDIAAVRLPPPTSSPYTAHAVYPYLLRGLHICRPNQVWQADITHLRLPGGTVYLCAILDVYSRKVLAWNLSNTMDAFLVLLAVTAAMERYGVPEIVNTDQGSQFTTTEWISPLEAEGVRISMDARGRAQDNVYIERWWGSFKREHFYLNQYTSLPALRRGIEEYVHFYNTRRFHQHLGYKRPAEVYFAEAPLAAAAG